jgi:hypothetical protein
MIRFLRWLILTSVAVGALLAVVALLGAEFGEIHAKIIGTSFSVTGAGMLALASLSAWERSRLGPLPGIGAATSIAAVALLIVGIWAETESGVYWKTMGTLLIVAAAVALVSLLSFGRLAHRYQWVVNVGFALAAILAVYAIALMWSEVEDQWAWRVFSVIWVLLASTTVAVPVLHRTGREHRIPHRALGLADEARFCPLCGEGLTAPFGESARCPSCGSTFQVDFTPAAST